MIFIHRFIHWSTREKERESAYRRLKGSHWRPVVKRQSAPIHLLITHLFQGHLLALLLVLLLFSAVLLMPACRVLRWQVFLLGQSSEVVGVTFNHASPGVLLYIITTTSIRRRSRNRMSRCLSHLIAGGGFLLLARRCRRRRGAGWLLRLPTCC